MDYISNSRYETQMYKIAVYGKGGVGKSSISSNLSYILSKRGMKVLHVGCDPKHDSTRLLTGGVPQRTFMDSMMEHTDGDVIETGSNGIYCVECGGAEPGIGCAGKGMTAMFSYVEKNTPADTDVRVCDVLGDVVCGGFSVPMRRRNVDGILLVLSEEFMSLYAANNILRGIRNLNGTDCVMGFVLNSRDPEDERRVESFSEATGLRMLARISRSAAFSKAESAGRTVSELFPGSPAARELERLADAVCGFISGKDRCQGARPLSDRAMMQIAAGEPVTDTDPPKVRKACSFDAYDRERHITYKGEYVMPACTSHGAFELLSYVEDAAVILHGPRNCAFLDEFAWRRYSRWTSFGRGRLLPCNVYSTGMDGRSVFTGDRGILEDTIKRAAADGFRYIFVVPTCTSETIGTDIRGVAETVDAGGATVVAVPSDESFLTSKFGCFAGAVAALCQIIDFDVPVERGTVSFVGYGLGFLGRRENRETVDRVLSAVGLRRNVSFVEPATVAELSGAASSEFLVQVHRYGLNDRVAQAFTGREVRVIESMGGMRGERRWVSAFSSMAGREADGKRFMEAEEEDYRKRLAHLLPRTRGKKALIYSRSDIDMDWHVDVLRDLGMEVLAIAHWRNRFVDHDERKSEYPDIPRIEDVELCSLGREAGRLGADIIVSADRRAGRAGMPWVGLFSMFMGKEGALDWAERVARSFSIKPEESWSGRRPR